MNFQNTSINKDKLPKNFKELWNSFELVSFYCNDSLKGFLNKPFFKKKRNQYLSAIVVFSAYFWYFLINVREAGRLGEGARTINQDTLIELTRITVVSFVNMCLIFSVILFVFVNSNISFTKSSIYITNILPYSRKEVLLAQKLFKMGVALIGYEAILLLVFPLLGQLSIVTVGNQFLLLLLFHLIFITVFLALDTCYALFTNITLKNNSYIMSSYLFILDIFLTVWCAIYLTYFKVRIEVFVGRLSIELTELIVIMLLIFGVVFIAILYLSNKHGLKMREYRKSSYGLVRLPMIKLNLMTSFSAIYRHRGFIHSLVLMLVFSLIVFYQMGFKSALETLANLNYILVISAVYYADATAKVRKFYDFFRVSWIEELFSLFLGGMLLSIIPTVVSIYFSSSMLPFFLSMTIYFCALIAGLLFPTNQGNLNETASTITAIFLSMVLYIIQKNDNIYLSSVILLVLLIILGMFLVKERRC